MTLLSGASPERRRALVISLLVSAGLIAMLGLSVPVLRDEVISARLEAAVRQDLGGPGPLPWETGPTETLCAKACPPRALAASGVRLIVRAAADTDEARRQGLLAQAEDRLTRALQARPASGGWWVWLAYAHRLQHRPVAVVSADLARSYALAPFLEQEGVWRARFCGFNWSQIDPRMRRHAVDEAVWMHLVDPEVAPLVINAFVDPGAAQALQAGLRAPPPASVPHAGGRGPGRIGAMG